MRKPIKRTRVDSSQPGIVKALRKFGVHVDVTGYPVDLLTYWDKAIVDRWKPIEVKPEGWKGWGNTKQEQDQKRYCERFNIPVVTNATQAIEAVTGLTVGRFRDVD